MSDSSKRICLDFTKSAKNLPRTENQGLVTTFIDLFRRSMGKDGSASHPESKVRRESFEITLMHTRSYEPWTLLDPQDLFRLFLGVGVCWRSFSVNSTASIPSDFKLSGP